MSSVYALGPPWEANSRRGAQAPAASLLALLLLLPFGYHVARIQDGAGLQGAIEQRWVKSQRVLPIIAVVLQLEDRGANEGTLLDLLKAEACPQLNAAEPWPITDAANAEAEVLVALDFRIGR